MGFFDQIYITATILGAITGLIASLARIAALAISKRRWTWETTFYQIILILVFSTSGAVTPFAYALNPVYGIFHYSFVVLSAVILGIFIFSAPDSEKAHLAWGYTFFAPIILLVIAVPLAVLPYFRSETPAPQVASVIRTQTITESFSRIQGVLNTIEKDIALESGNIDKAIEGLIKEKETRNNELQILAAEQSRMAEEVESYKLLASLTEDQR